MLVYSFTLRTTTAATLSALHVKQFFTTLLLSTAVSIFTKLPAAASAATKSMSKQTNGHFLLKRHYSLSP